METSHRELLLLGLLRRQEMHGYQLTEFISRDLSSCTDLKKPTAYFLLNKMAEAGWIEEEQIQEGNRPPRRVFHLTSAGEIEFQRLLRDNLGNHAPVYFPDDVGLAMLDGLTSEEGLGLLAIRRAAVASALERARTAPAHTGNMQLVIDHQVRHGEAELNWLDEVISRLKG